MEDDLEFKSMSGQLAVDEAQGIVECFVAAVGNKDSVGDVVVSGAFNASFKRRKPRVVWGHDWNQPIGKVLDIYEVPSSDPRLPAKMKEARVGGLYAKVQFNLKSERGREAFNSITFFGEDQEWSIGYKTLDSIYSPERQANLLKEVELYEVSPVLHGANQLTATISIKSLDVNSMDKEKVTSFRKSKWDTFDFAWAKKLREEHPDIWKAGGNIKGNDQWEILSKILENGGMAETEDQVKALELREAWIARHEGDFRLPGVIAQIKWLAVGKQGESAMKKVVNDEIKRRKERMQGKAEKTCPIATQDISVNIKNRQSAIDKAGYGPLNPKEPNAPFWAKKADRWDVTADEAKKQTCGNCAAFIRTPSMLKCIKGALGNEAGNEAMDVINAGQLGYCEAFDFKCASARTCDAWIVGGPVTEEKDQTKEEEAEYSKAAVVDTSEFALSLARDLAAEVSMSVRVTEIDKGYVVFDVKDPESGSLETMRAEFEFDGAEFSFSNIESYEDDYSSEEDDSEDFYFEEDIPLVEDDSEEPSDESDTEEEWRGSSPQLKEPCGCGCEDGMIKAFQMGNQAGRTVDRDGDGVVFDGTPDERPAARRQDNSRTGRSVKKRAKFSDGSTTVMNPDGSGEIITRDGRKYSYGPSNEQGSLSKIPKRYRKGMEKLHTDNRSGQQAAAGSFAENPIRDMNKPKTSTFGDGAKTRVEEDGSGSITTPDGQTHNYGNFEDPEALKDVPAKYRAGLKKARRQQNLKNRQAAEVAKQRGYRMNPSTRPKSPEPKKYPKASQLNPDGTPKEPDKLILNPDGSIYEPPKQKTDQMDEQEIKAPNASQLESLANVAGGDVLPQERVTGDVLRGYGPRRGNLERLLRYWRPIMRKEGGFRRCLVILADHPELYPLQNICAWLHHETTGLWPNEGCHHPGMKNCRRKIRGVVRGSLISDSEFDNRLRRMSDGKGMPDPFEDDYEKGYMGDVTDEDVEYAYKVMNWFAGEEKEFMNYLIDDKNWMHEGDDDEGMTYEHEWVKPVNAPVGLSGKPGGCGCGCSMKEAGCGCDREEKTVDVELLNDDDDIELLDDDEFLDDVDFKEFLFDIDAKAGRVLNSRNLDKLRQAAELILNVVGTASAESIEMKTAGTIAVSDENIEGLIEAIEPVFDYYEIEAEITDFGVEIKDFANVSEDAKSAIEVAIGNFNATEVEEKALGGRIGRVPGGNWRPRDGDGDGKFSLAEGLPDETPVPPGMDKFEDEIRKLSDSDLRDRVRKTRSELEEMPDGPEKVKKTFKMGVMQGELGRRVDATDKNPDWEKNMGPRLMGTGGDRTSPVAGSPKPGEIRKINKDMELVNLNDEMEVQNLTERIQNALSTYEEGMAGHMQLTRTLKKLEDRVAENEAKKGSRRLMGETAKPESEEKPNTYKPNPRSTGKENPREGHELLYGGKLGPYPVSGTDAEKEAWKKAYADKIRYMKKDQFVSLRGSHQIANNQALRGVIEETEEEKETRRQASRIVELEKARRIEYARGGRGGGSRPRSAGTSSSGSRPGWSRFRRVDNGEYVWYDDNTDDAQQAMQDGFIERE